MTAKNYPITQPFGQDPTYPLNNGFHRGIDYGCPTGTPVEINNTVIGLSGASGAVTGPHLHVGKFVNGAPVDPTGGFELSDAVVSEVGSDSINGNFVKLKTADALWVYLHLSKVLVSKGQVIKGEDMGQIEALTKQRDDVTNKLIEAEKANIATGEEVTKAFLTVQKKEPSKEQYVFYTTRPRIYLYNDLLGLGIVK